MLEGRTADRELEDGGFFHGEPVQRKPQYDREGSERRKPLDARARTVAPLGDVDQVPMALVERVAHVDERDPLEAHRLRNREAILEGRGGELVAADHVGFIEIGEVAGLSVLDSITQAVRVAAEEEVARLVLAL